MWTSDPAKIQDRKEAADYMAGYADTQVLYPGQIYPDGDEEEEEESMDEANEDDAEDAEEDDTEENTAENAAPKAPQANIGEAATLPPQQPPTLLTWQRPAQPQTSLSPRQALSRLPLPL